MTADALNAPTSEFLAALRERLGPQGLREGDAAAPYLREPRDTSQGQAALVVRPGSVEEVSHIVRACAEARVALVPYSGGTGLVGGQVRPEGPPCVLISVERLNRVRALHPDDDAMICEAGVILADAQAAAASVDRLFPLSIASEGTARIGGVLGTNAGGVNVLRYGMTRDLCLGLEAVLPDGSVFNGLKRLRKDNTGYDLRHLLIGAEGTLGVITAAALRLHPRPAEISAAFVAVPSPAAALELLHLLRGRVGEQVSAFELMQGSGIRFCLDEIPGARCPLDPVPEWSALVEVGGGAGSGAAEALEAALEEAFEKGLALDGALAQSEQQRADFWRLRETIPEANRKIGSIASHDISAPLSEVASFVTAASERLLREAPDIRINAFGHLGDGNLHYNLFPAKGRKREDYANIKPVLTRIVHDLIDAHGGSISAEHGIGRFKTADLVHYGDPAKLAAMRAIKDALDPAGIMNPGAVLG
ncbi:MAG: hydroxyacid dehydrogenase [Rhodobacteraceae bacterium]|nr:hydroxyacid dehydrogenase [Paracoccaceae bacterium]MBR28232.1 hydroxyacid dehydrogenase [Paracoccaceae bacterium]